MYSTRRGICGTLTLAASLLIAGCGNSNNANVRTVNASPGLTGYSVQVGQTGIAFSLPYGTEGVQPPGQYSTDDSSGNYRLIGAGPSQPVVLYQKAGTNLATSTLSMVKGSYYTIVNVGIYPTIGLMNLTDNDSAPTSGDFKLRVVGSSSSIGPVDVYLTAPGAPVSGNAVSSNLLFQQVTPNYLQLAPGSFEIQITPHGSTAVLAKTAFSPASGQIYSVFVLDPAPGSNSFGVLVTNDPVSATATTTSTTTGG